MLPHILRPPRYNTPVAALTLDGLGICRFNPATMEWQVAFLRKGHRLLIGVKKVNLEGRIILSHSPVEVPPLAEHLRLTVSNPSSVHLSASEFPNGFFRDQSNFPSAERKTRDDSYDYRWVMDLINNEVPHQFNRLLRKGERHQDDTVTIISIPLALFYTKRVTSDSVILARHDQTSEQGFVFGRTNELVGAGLYSMQPAAAVELMDVATGVPLPNFPALPAVVGHVYEISILNLDARVRGKLDALPRDVIGNYVPGDLHLYYAVMDAPPATRHQLFAPPRSGPRAIDGDCHLGGAGHRGGSFPDLDLMTLIQP